MCILCGVAYVTIVGASGYTGQETLDRVLAHPELELYAVGSDSLAGQEAAALDPRLNRNGGRRVPHFITNEAALAVERGHHLPLPRRTRRPRRSSRPPRASSSISPAPTGCTTQPTTRPGTASRIRTRRSSTQWMYGLPELVAGTGRLIANPGCYATAALLALGPLRTPIDPDSVVVDAKSGMTGAGRTLKASTHAGFVLDNVSPYKVGRHQHVPEIAQLLGFPVSFTPHLLPVRRGLIATCYVRSTGPDLRALLEAHYASSHVVTVLPEGVAPELARVQNTDLAEIGVFEDRFTDRTIVVCAEDNLGKGAAGQAIQNVNRAFGFADTDGLRLSGVRV